MYYGNASADDMQTVAPLKAAVWDTNYKGVWHLPNGATLSAVDSTGIAGTLSMNGTVSPTTGKIDGGASFPGSPANLYGGYTANLKLALPWTLEIWYKRNSSTQNGVLLGITASDGNSGIGIGVGNIAGYFANNSIVVLKPGIYNGGGAYAPLDTNWHHLAVTVDTTNGELMYLDGSYVGVDTNKSNISTLNNDAVFLGSWVYYINAYFIGLTDEARISHSIRSADWIKTEYNNQSSPSTFYTLSGSNPSVRPANIPMLKSRGGVQMR
jgi:hypothetical protein